MYSVLVYVHNIKREIETYSHKFPFYYTTGFADYLFIQSFDFGALLREKIMIRHVIEIK